MRWVTLYVGFLLILSGIIFLILSPNVYRDYWIPYWIASLLVISSGVLFIIKSKDHIVSIFVCGECNRNFLSETDLRTHYSKEHIKNRDDSSTKAT